jgi:acyl carrier protein
LVTTNDLKEKIIDGLGLEDIELDEIEDDMALFGDEGLGLDSVDAIELTLILEKEFGVKVTNMEESSSIFATPNTLVAYINEYKASNK